MRLIDADALLSQYKGNILTAQIDYAQGARDVIEDIKNAPTVEPELLTYDEQCIFLAAMARGGAKMEDKQWQNG